MRSRGSRDLRLAADRNRAHFLKNSTNKTLMGFSGDCLLPGVVRVLHLAAMKRYVDRDQAGQTASDAEYGRRSKIAALPHYQLVPAGQAELIEGKATGDRFSRLVRRAEFLIASAHERSVDIRTRRRSSGGHYRVREGNVRRQREIAGSTYRPENGDAHQRHDLDLLSLHVFQNFGGDEIGRASCRER